MNVPSGRHWTLDDFEIGMKVGSGQYGKIYLAREKQSKFVVALKAISKKYIARSGITDLLKNEIEIQSRLRHPNILNLYGYFWDDSTVYLIMEYGFYGDLKKELNAEGFFTEKKAAWYVKRIASAIQAMHAMGILHRDIKTENILIGENREPKLCDFGWAVHCEKDTRNTVCGTVEYIPPEIGSGSEYSYAADLWSLGILTYELCTGKTPYPGVSLNEVQDKIQHDSIQYPDTMTSVCQDFISSLLVQSPEQRMSIQHVLSHEWLKETM